MDSETILTFWSLTDKAFYQVDVEDYANQNKCLHTILESKDSKALETCISDFESKIIKKENTLRFHVCHRCSRETKNLKVIKNWLQGKLKQSQC